MANGNGVTSLPTNTSRKLEVAHDMGRRDGLLRLMLRGLARYVARKNLSLKTLIIDLRCEVAQALFDLHGGVVPRLWAAVVGSQATSYNMNGERRAAAALHNQERRLLETVSDTIRGKTATFEDLCAIAEQAPQVARAVSSHPGPADAVRATVARLIRASMPDVNLDDPQCLIAVPSDIEIGGTRSTDEKATDQYDVFMAGMARKVSGEDNDAVFRVWTDVPEERGKTTEVAVYDVMRHLTRVTDAGDWKGLADILSYVEAKAVRAESLAKLAPAKSGVNAPTIKLNVAVGFAMTKEGE